MVLWRKTILKAEYFIYLVKDSNEGIKSASWSWYLRGFPSASVVKNPSAARELQVWYPWVRNIPWRRAWQPTPVFLAGESHGQSLVGYRLQSVGLERVRHDWRDWARTCDILDWNLKIRTSLWIFFYPLVVFPLLNF